LNEFPNLANADNSWRDLEEVVTQKCFFAPNSDIPEEYLKEVICLCAFEFAKSPVIGNAKETFAFWEQFEKFVKNNEGPYIQNLSLRSIGDLAFTLVQRNMLSVDLWDK
jgi:hypothetical protein